MTESIPTLVVLVSAGVVLLQVLLIAALLAYLFTSKNPITFLPRSVRAHLIPIAFVVTLGMAALTLYFEYAFGYLPCELCWWQRVFLFPQIILFGLASYKRDRSIIDYSLVLSGIGFLIGVFNYALLYAPSLAPCPAVGVSCAKVYFLVFGYVTFPLWAVTGFAFLIALMLMERARDGEAR